ncbi:HSP20 family molecular chaperone IbpA [Amycolatopsis lexingtonensis]|uniref:HSP20 family molecular chaperone IbpA n=1 Tax=Amycolatopsis lexingtonensis TaxID=218822 RepID=A0ABR9HSZ4_9PSEU|nr:Hsp20/alpha crystallin family protein [Amycolatopsis lexingtonensis]MBE1494010.1 HSP20 family molecular chaperone IbpA [Amycolatopsis lexingtonensis]
MTSLLPRTMFPGLTEWFDEAWPFGEHNPVRIEEAAEEGKYVLRAELPGFDPEKGVHVATENGLLTISAQREARTEAKGRSEFRYGSFSRTVRLPKGAEAAKIAATYHNGILEVTVPVAKTEAAGQVEIPITKD